jgi:hypothetical protein
LAHLLRAEDALARDVQHEPRLFDPEKEIDRHGRSHDNHKAPYPSLRKSLSYPGAAVATDNSGRPDDQSGHPVNFTNSEEDDDSQRIECRRQDDLEGVWPDGCFPARAYPELPVPEYPHRHRRILRRYR